jgi:hypothetical protein
MDKKTKGAWIVHHAKKLQNVTDPTEFENTFHAGKACILLSAISSDDQITMSRKRVEVLARASQITKLELPALLSTLEKQELIDISGDEISVLGVTPSSTLGHAADIFDSFSPESQELAAIDIAESASQKPVKLKEASERISDTYRFDRSASTLLLDTSVLVGFVDVEEIDKDEKLIFNGNLFRREHAPKIAKILSSLSSQESQRLLEVTKFLSEQACVPLETIKHILGNDLFMKVSAIGFFDINVVSNFRENAAFITLPSAFSKYGGSMVSDAFDLAKAFISSISYGMTRSSYERGQIQMVSLLLKTLIRGDSVGPVRAIKEDYKILEMKGVIEVKDGWKKGRYGPMMKLLKKEVGELVLQLIEQGDISEHSLNILPEATVTEFKGPEHNRRMARRTQLSINPKATNDMLSVLRTGGFS